MQSNGFENMVTKIDDFFCAVPRPGEGVFIYASSSLHWPGCTCSDLFSTKPCECSIPLELMQTSSMHWDNSGWLLSVGGCLLPSEATSCMSVRPALSFRR
mmetsp:Transcript_26333/g.87259  ORF Transcript_26333/g.87259 Transcript_26333/m.87259 type:complete len:100 (+) Transcript_26333:1616-1915(+)